MWYIFNLTLIFFYYFLIKVKCPKPGEARKLFAIMVGIHIFLFRALANPFDYVDTGNYEMAFSSIREMSLKECILEINPFTHMGLGFVFLNWLVSRFTDNYIFFSIICSFIGVIPVIWFYYKSNQKMLFPIFMYLTYPAMFHQSIGVLRQHISVSIMLIAIFYIDNLKKSMPFSLLSCLFHTSGIVILPFYLWKKLEINKIRSSKFLLCSLSFIILFKAAMWDLLSYLPKYEEIISDGSENNIIPVLWMSAITLFTFFIPIKKMNYSGIERNIVSFFFYGLLISICCIGLNGMGRFTICFYYIIPLASLIFIKSHYTPVVRYGIYISNIFITLIMLYFSVPTHNYNYTFYWE